MMTINSDKDKTGIYIHIPFCVRKCSYCGFLSFPMHDEEIRGKYVKHLIKEIKSSRKCSADTVFIGGGTPSLLSVEEIDDIMETLYDTFEIDPAAEVTIEANPGTLDGEKLRGLKGCGINRLSIGVQSFDNDILYSLGRIHTAEDALKTVDAARKIGFDNINTDLMFAVPGHSMDIWENSLRQAVCLEPEHISFYSLQLEENTPLYDDYRRGKKDLPDESVENEMYFRAVKKLEDAGYCHYEISNASKPGFFCRHNRKYWSMGEYMGFGLGAHSFIHDDGYGMRYCNTDEPEEYYILTGEGKPPADEKSICHDSISDSMGIFSFTALRTREGIDLLKFRRYYGREFFDVYVSIKDRIEMYIREGLMELSGGYLRLTMKGISCSNSIMCEFV